MRDESDDNLGENDDGLLAILQMRRPEWNFDHAGVEYSRHLSRFQLHLYLTPPGSDERIRIDWTGEYGQPTVDLVTECIERIHRDLFAGRYSVQL